jgi:hypothetical protein
MTVGGFSRKHTVHTSLPVGLTVASPQHKVTERSIELTPKAQSNAHAEILSKYSLKHIPQVTYFFSVHLPLNDRCTPSTMQTLQRLNG